MLPDRRTHSPKGILAACGASRRRISIFGRTASAECRIPKSEMEEGNTVDAMIASGGMNGLHARNMEVQWQPTLTISVSWISTTFRSLRVSTTSGGATVPATNTTSVATNGIAKRPARKENPKKHGAGLRRMPSRIGGFCGPPMPPVFPTSGRRRNGPVPPSPPHFRVHRIDICGTTYRYR
nr:uncharacterized protein LOC115263844 [Aedes albopictus]